MKCIALCNILPDNPSCSFLSMLYNFTSIFPVTKFFGGLTNGFLFIVILHNLKSFNHFLDNLLVSKERELDVVLHVSCFSLSPSSVIHQLACTQFVLFENVIHDSFEKKND